MTSSRIVPCAQCAALNRVPLQIAASAEVKCGKCKSGLPSEKFVHDVTGSALDRIVVNSPIPVVVDCWAPWCSPCLAFAPTFEQHARAFAGGAIYLKLNTEDEQMASSKLNIRSIPTLIVFENEREKARMSGALPAPQLKQWLGQQGVS